MNEEKLITEFINSNLNDVMQFARSAYKNVDERVQIKIKSAYTKYLKSARTKFSKTKSFFIRDRAVDLYSYYVPTKIRGYSTTINIPTFKNCILKSC